MAYTTLTFLLFAAVTAVVYFLFPVKKYQWTALLAASYVFYLWSSFRLAGFLLFTTVTVWGTGVALERISVTTRRSVAEHKTSWSREEKKAFRARAMSKKRRLLTVSLLANFGILVFLKYFNFLAGSLNELFAAGAGIPSLPLLLPLGISFYTFQSAGYLLDVYWEKYPAEKNPAKFALFVSFFPQILQGPIGFYDRLTPELYAPHRPEERRALSGILLMLWGHAKKMILADRAAPLITSFTSGAALSNVDGSPITASGSTAVFIVLLYALQLYADFSGGIDISRGFAEILGIPMGENFRRPYFSASLGEYWRRWHISLGEWMKNYIFYPVGMSKLLQKISRRIRERAGTNPAALQAARAFPACAATLLVFLLVGLWHGANWKYAAFGVFNGVVMALSQLFAPAFPLIKKRLHIRSESFPWRIWRILRTFLLVLTGYFFDIASDLGSALSMMRSCVTDFRPNPEVLRALLSAAGLDPQDLCLLLAGAVFLFLVSLAQERRPETTIRERLLSGPAWRQDLVFLAGIFAVAVFGVYGPGVSAADFVYAQF